MHDFVNWMLRCISLGVHNSVQGNRTQRRALRIDAALPLLFLLAATPVISQEAVDSGARHSPAVITGIAAAERGDSIEVEVTLSSLVRAEVSTVEHPDRLVFDFPGCVVAHPGQRLVVNRGSIVAVRAATFSVAPPTARVVIDLKSAQDHSEAYVGNRLVIKLKLSPSTATSGANQPPANSQPRGPESDRAPPKPLDAAPSATIQPHAYALLGKAKELNISDLDALEAKAQSGNPESQTMLALAYHAGTLLKMDDAKALQLLRQAASRDFVAAEEAMGIFCQAGFGMAPDKTQAVSWYTKAAQHGSRDAATNLALMYANGDGIPKDFTQAATWFRSAAEAGDATAQLNLAALYHRGEGVPQDDTQAALWLTRAANQGLLAAMLELAGWDLRPEHGANVDAAIGWYKKAADQGDASAQATLGDIFSDPKLGRLDYSQAVDWYKRAADQRQPRGEFGLGTRYLLGQGVPQDLDEARRWLTPAANLGHPFAQLSLAKMLEAGEGGPVDVAAAAKYYELAANSGIAEAQYRLGILLASDRSNGTTLVSAYKWLVLAQDSVKESGATVLQIQKLLTAPQLAQAEHEIDQWRIAHPVHSASH